MRLSENYKKTQNNCVSVDSNILSVNLNSADTQSCLHTGETLWMWTRSVNKKGFNSIWLRLNQESRSDRQSVAVPVALLGVERLKRWDKWTHFRRVKCRIWPCVSWIKRLHVCRMKREQAVGGWWMADASIYSWIYNSNLFLWFCLVVTHFLFTAAERLPQNLSAEEKTATRPGARAGNLTWSQTRSRQYQRCTH